MLDIRYAACKLATTVCTDNPPMMIDVFNHFMPKAYLDRLGDLIPGHPVLTAFPRLKTLWDVERRRALLDEFGGTQHVLSLANPPPELIGPPDKTPSWCAWRTISLPRYAANIRIISRPSSPRCR